MSGSDEESAAIVQQDGETTGVRVRQDSMLPNQYFVVEEFDDDGARERVTLGYDEMDDLMEAIEEVRPDA